jgi:benzoylformate decarboxylase
MLEMLRAEGVEHIFGNPGSSESPIMHELESFPDLKYVLVLQEGVAMGMADAYARATRRPSFVNLHIETGLANGISLLHNAFAGGTPLVLSAGNKDIRELAHGRTDLAEMARPFTKWTAEVTHPEQVPFVMRRAFNEAQTPPMGPTFVAFSANALDGETEVEIVASPTGYSRNPPDARAVEDAADLLAAASNPVMIVGDRVADSGASAEAVRVAELLGAPVYASVYSEMSFPTSHTHFGGPIRLGFPDTRKMLSAANVALVVGKLSSSSMFSGPVLQFIGPGTKLVHIDSDPSGVGSTQSTDVGMVADPAIALGRLAEALDATMSSSAREAAKGRSANMASARAAADAERDRRTRERWDDSPMSPSRMMAEVASTLPPETIIVDDAVTTRGALYDAMEFDEPGSVYGSRGGALGWGIGGGMGIKLANPDKPVVAVVGDGSAMMTVQGFWTTANEGLPVVYVVCNNDSYRILKLNIDKYRSMVLGDDGQSQYLGMDFPLPLGVAGMARSMGVSARTIEDPDDVAPAMRAAMNSGKPAVLDVVIDGSLVLGSSNTCP